MGTITAQTIIDKVSGALLADTNKVRFTQAHLLGHLNEAIRLLCAINPATLSAYMNAVLVAGTKQALPAGTHLLMQPRRNMGAGGATPGATITSVSMEVLDVLKPGWHTEAQAAVIKHVMYDDERPGTFWTYPPAVAGTQIECLFAQVHADIAAGTAIPVDDVYEAPIMNYMLARTFEKDAEYAGNMARAESYYGLMAQQLGVKAQALRANSTETEAKAGSDA